jgi:hypothetical protein
MMVRSIAPAAALALLALLAPTGEANAQDTGSVSYGQYLFGIGVNKRGDQQLLPSLQVGREWREGGSRVGLRLTGDFNEARTRTPYYPYYYVDGPTGGSESRTRDATFGVAGTYTLAKGRIQPYLISGFTIGYQKQTFRYDADPRILIRPDGQTNTSFGWRNEQMTFGLQAGLGLSVRLRTSTLFVEARTLRQSDHNSQTPGPRPITFGIKF